LTCNELNFVQKAGAQKYAAEHGLIIVCPDTSPRNVNIPGEDDAYDFGSGAGFYVDATVEPWKKHYKMFSYITSELIDLVNKTFPTLPDRCSIFGHSMGGHGALICALKSPGLFKSVSAFAPISNPSKCAWGEKAFGGYLGEDREAWKQWDTTELVAKYNGPLLELYIDQGNEDNFLKDQQLLPHNLVEACKKAQVPCVLNMRDGYDHSYFYIATFVGEHIAYHAKHLLS
jgi:S-formylglutathione hydrolase